MLLCARGPSSQCDTPPAGFPTLSCAARAGICSRADCLMGSSHMILEETPRWVRPPSNGCSQTQETTRGEVTRGVFLHSHALSSTQRPRACPRVPQRSAAESEPRAPGGHVLSAWAHLTHVHVPVCESALLEAQGRKIKMTICRQMAGTRQSGATHDEFTGHSEPRPSFLLRV